MDIKFKESKWQEDLNVYVEQTTTTSSGMMGMVIVPEGIEIIKDNAFWLTAMLAKLKKIHGACKFQVVMYHTLNHCGHTDITVSLFDKNGGQLSLNLRQQYHNDVYEDLMKICEYFCFKPRYKNKAFILTLDIDKGIAFDLISEDKAHKFMNDLD